MHGLKGVAWGALWLSWMVSGSASAHGGPPATYDVLLGAGPPTLVTSHGLFSEDMGWGWICDEATDSDLAHSVTRTPSRWVVGTMAGLMTSVDGCDWVLDPVLSEAHILHVLQDVADPERVWVATMESLWTLDGLREAELYATPEISVRHLGQRPDGELIVLGFEGPEPVALLGQARISLPTEGGRLEVLSADAQGRVYLRLPTGLSDRLVRVDEEGAEVLVEETGLIRDLVSLGEDLYLLTRDGVLWSTDDGRSWSAPLTPAIRCLRPSDEGLYACPPETSPAALLFSETQAGDPTLWTWESRLDFAEVNQSTCGMWTSVRTICPFVWEEAAVELGVLTPPSQPDALKDQGCAAPPPGRWPLVLLSLMALWWAWRTIGNTPRRAPQRVLSADDTFSAAHGRAALRVIDQRVVDATLNQDVGELRADRLRALPIQGRVTDDLNTQRRCGRG